MVRRERGLKFEGEGEAKCEETVEGGEYGCVTMCRGGDPTCVWAQRGTQVLVLLQEVVAAHMNAHQETKIACADAGRSGGSRDKCEKMNGGVVRDSEI